MEKVGLILGIIASAIAIIAGLLTMIRYLLKGRNSNNSRSITHSDIIYPLIAVPFNDTFELVLLRELNQAQLEMFGAFSLIDIYSKSCLENSLNIEDKVKYAQTMSEIARISLIKPTYDEIMTLVDDEDMLKGGKEKLQSLREKLYTTPECKERKELEDQISLTAILYDLILPVDFLSTIASYALKLDKIEIKFFTDDVLIDCALLAKNSRNNPSDHISGIFTKFTKDDINRRAWIVFRKWCKTEPRKVRNIKKKELLAKISKNG